MKCIKCYDKRRSIRKQEQYNTRLLTSWCLALNFGRDTNTHVCVFIYSHCLSFVIEGIRFTSAIPSEDVQVVINAEKKLKCNVIVYIKNSNNLKLRDIYVLGIIALCF